MGRVEQGLTRTSRATDGMSDRMQRGFAGVGRAATALTGILAGFGVVLSTRALLEYGQAFTDIQNKLRVTGVSTEDLATRTRELFDVANAARQPIEAIATLYQRASLAAGELGINQTELLDFTETVAQALTIQGTSAGQATGALLQLSQALGSGTVRAEEFNSILEGALPIAQAAARGIEEAGGSVAKLRTLVIEGKISSQEFFQAIQAGAPQIAEAFATAVPTVSQAITNLKNSMTELVGSVDQSARGTQSLAEAINLLATAMREPALQEFAREMAADIAAGVASSVREITRLIDLAQSLREAWAAPLGLEDLPGLAGVGARAAAGLTEQFNSLFGAQEDVAGAARDATQALQEQQGVLADTEASAAALEDVLTGHSLDDSMNLVSTATRALAGDLDVLGATGTRAMRQLDRLDETMIRANQARLRANNTGLRQRRERADFEVGRAREAETANIFGLPPRQEFIAEQERFRLRQEGASQAEIADMEPMIEDLARAEQHLILMNETAPELAGTLADIGQIAVFDGLEAAGERFLQMLVEMLFQAVALQIVMAGMSAFGVGGGAGAAVAPPGVGPGGMGFTHFGGPRQHGGRVRQGSAYLVGEAGPELFVPSTGGAVVPGRMAATGSGGAPGITVNVTNNAQNAQVTAGRPRMGVDGRPIVDVMVADSLDRMHGGGQLDRMLGGRRTGVRRS